MRAVTHAIERFSTYSVYPERKGSSYLVYHLCSSHFRLAFNFPLVIHFYSYLYSSTTFSCLLLETFCVLLLSHNLQSCLYYIELIHLSDAEQKIVSSFMLFGECCN